MWEPHLARPAFVGRVFGGHRWGYELEPVDGASRVRAVYDWSTANAITRGYVTLVRWPQRARRAMAATLECLESVVTRREPQPGDLDLEAPEG